MAKISLNKAGQYSVQGNTSEFFTLKDDGDIAEVRFLYEEADGSDMDFYLVHVIEIGEGKNKRRKYISCLAVDEEGRMHRDDCPLCKAGMKTQEKLFLQLYDETDGKLKIWERGKTFVPKIVSFLNRYGALVSRGFEIERKGKKGDMKTTYELFALEKDNKTLADFPQKIQIEGTFVIKASKADMIAMVDGTYDFGDKSANKEEPKQEQPVERRGSRRRVAQDDEF